MAVTDQATFLAIPKSDAAGAIPTYQQWTPFGSGDHGICGQASADALYLIRDAADLSELRETFLFDTPPLSTSHTEIATGNPLPPVPWSNVTSGTDIVINGVQHVMRINMRTALHQISRALLFRRRSTGAEFSDPTKVILYNAPGTILFPSPFPADPTEDGWRQRFNRSGSADPFHATNPITGLAWDISDFLTDYEYGLATTLGTGGNEAHLDYVTLTIIVSWTPGASSAVQLAHAPIEIVYDYAIAKLLRQGGPGPGPSPEPDPGPTPDPGPSPRPGPDPTPPPAPPHGCRVD